ncbi:MAG: MmgE/PrpD family protein [Solobacterium sp.]|nr:MmgE/PrpD family protein [Solobacterium sp.]
MAEKSFFKELVSFVCDFQTDPSLEEYRYYFLNYLAVTYSGSEENAVSIAAKYAESENPGLYQPLGRSEKLSPAGCVRTDCFSSAIEAYDDIHFATTAHPCGPVASALLGIARTQKVTLNEFLHALMIGMEAECRTGVLLFTNGSRGWYTTSVCGLIGAAAGCARLLRLNRNQTENALALAASCVCGNRGTHGAMAGSWMPAIGAEKGYEAARLASLGFTCSTSSLEGKMGMVNLVTDNPAYEEALEGLGETLISKEVSCKPYPYGFISFGVLECLSHLHPHKDIEEVILEVSERAALLGKNPFPSTMYEGFVSLAFIAARALLDPVNLYQPLWERIELSEEEKDLIRKIRIIPQSSYTDDMAKVTVIDAEGSETVYCDQPSGSSKKPMTGERVIQKVKTLGLSDEVITLIADRSFGNRILSFRENRLTIE